MQDQHIARLSAIIAAWGAECPQTGAGLCDGVAGISGGFRSMALRSVFQPLFSAGDLRPRAHEALLRVVDGRGAPIAPPEAFAALSSPAEIILFDRLCRLVHVLNFVRRGGGGDLFLNIHSLHLLSVGSGEHGRVFEALLKQCDLSPRRIVLEVLEARIDDLGHLRDAVDAYRGRGYRVAIDDFGSQHSNFDRLWHLTPDIVKLDRGLIVEAVSNPRARRILPKLVDLIHEMGATVVCEGIETADQHRLAVDAGADLLQGYRYARPSEHPHAAPPDVADGPVRRVATAR